jgi:predicted lipoprotein with Yx(FWY)xxD motif
VYYVLLAMQNDPVELATISLQADLRSISSKAVVIDFNQGELVRDYDDDQDGKSNLDEVCAGEDPRFRGE